ncbi:hypothetical protein ACWGS9_13825 [Bradyrhizobium sp. Arg314]
MFKRLRFDLIGLADRAKSNPGILLLIVLLAISIGSHYQTGRELDRLCELTGLYDGYPAQPTPNRAEIDSICADRMSGDDPQ